MTTKKKVAKKTFDAEQFAKTTLENDSDFKSRFKQSLNDDYSKGELIDYIKEKYGISKREAKASIENFSILHSKGQATPKKTLKQPKTFKLKKKTIVSPKSLWSSEIEKYIYMTKHNKFKNVVKQLKILYYGDSNTNTKPQSILAIGKLAKYLHKEITFCSPIDTKEIRYYDPYIGRYQENGDKLIELICREVFPIINDRLLTQIKSFIKTQKNPYCYQPRSNLDRHPYIALQNGVLDTEKVNIYKFNRRFYLTRGLNITYNPDMECPEIDETLDSWVSKKDKETLIEWLAYCLYPKYIFHVLLLTWGDPRAGKTTFFNLVKAFLGGNVSEVRPHQLIDQEDSALASIHGTYATLAGEIKDEIITNTETFNALTGQTGLSYHKLYIGQIQFTNTSKIAFQSISPPKFHDTGKAIYTRLLPVHFHGSFIGKEDSTLVTKLTAPDELSGLLNQILPALQELLKRGRFLHQPKSIEEAEATYNVISNRVKLWITEKKEESLILVDKKYQIPCINLKFSFDTWCKDNNYSPYGERMFYSLLKEAVPTVKQRKTRIRGEQTRVYLGITDVEYEKIRT